MKKIRAAVVGYGNIGKYALEACAAMVQRTSPQNWHSMTW